MKLIYQHLLSFLLIILTTISIIGYAELDYAKNQAYEQNFHRMEGYAQSLGSLAVAQENSGEDTLSVQFLEQLQSVLKGEQVHLQIFNAQNEQIYPKSLGMKLNSSVFKLLKKGREIRIKNNNVQSFYIGQTKDAYTGVLIPWFNNQKLIGIVWIGSTVRNVEKPIMMAKRNLLNALLISLLVGIVLSLVLAYYSTTKIKRLSRATEKVATGDFDVQIKHKDHDEIDQLASNFNRMVRELKKSSEEIKAQEKRRDQFMADAAHEMRTPLTTINGILEGLQYDAIPEESKPKSIDLMRRETKRLIRLVNENLDYEKIRSNQIALTKTVFDASVILHDVKTQMMSNAEKVNDKLVLDVPEKIEVYADVDRFKQIMVNLVQNAIQFTNNGTITIVANRIDHGAEFRVIDNGIGMSEEQTKYIFERFFKADPSRAKLGFGESGLGLAIVASLIEQHGGKVKVDSKPDEGSTFTVILYDQGYEQFVK